MQPSSLALNETRPSVTRSPPSRAVAGRRRVVVVVVEDGGRAGRREGLLAGGLAGWRAGREPQASSQGRPARDGGVAHTGQKVG